MPSNDPSASSGTPVSPVAASSDNASHCGKPHKPDYNGNMSYRHPLDDAPSFTSNVTAAPTSASSSGSGGVNVVAPSDLMVDIDEQIATINSLTISDHQNYIDERRSSS